jgi:molecular chaperone GrpE
MAKKNVNKESGKEEPKAAKSTDNKKDTKGNKGGVKRDSQGKTGKEKPEKTKITEQDSKGDSAKEEQRELSPIEILAEQRDKYLRLSAEFDNYRKRTLKEKMDLTKTAGENLLVSLLPVMDDFDRAMKLMENATDCGAMKDGIDLIYSKFNDFLKQNGVKIIESDNCEFDTDLHEAITKIPAPEKRLKGKVVDTIQKGYYLHDKVIRYSKVVIGE